jgi:hypothetical protein
MPKSSSSASIFSISDSDSSTFVPEKKNAGRGNKRKRVSVLKTKIKREAGKQLGSLDIEDAAEYIRRPHEAAYHGMVDIVALQIELLVWFDVVRLVHCVNLEHAQEAHVD